MGGGIKEKFLNFCKNRGVGVKWWKCMIYNLRNKMEQKKQLLIDILKQLEWHRDLAPWFLVVVEKTWNNEIIDTLLNLIQMWIKSIKDKRIRSKLVNRVKELQKKWDLDQENSSKEADSLLDDFINNIEN